MKNRISKILGIGLALVLALALVAGFAVPVAASPGETINEWYKFEYPEAGADGDWFRMGTWDAGERIHEVREITEAINGDLYAYVETDGDGNGGPYDHIFKSTDGGRSWEATGYEDVEVCDDDDHPVQVFDMVCSSIDEDVLYVTDGQYVYKTDDGGDTFDFVARATLEEQLEGECDCCIDDFRTITCIDVGYDDDETPYVYIGTREHWADCIPTPGDIPGSIYYIAEGTFGGVWTEVDLSCYGTGYDVFAIGCAPDFADSWEVYSVVSDDSETHVVKGIGGACPVEFAELWYDCVVDNDFDIFSASRIAFPDDWEDSQTLFVGVTDFGPGGDVYSVTQDSALDRNVAGISSGCIGIEAVDIISLDIKGDYDEASLIAGAFGDPYVYYSYDGGWSWDISTKHPTGTRWTYVIWYEDTALAATSGCECAVSMSCVSDDVEDVGEAWNQISLIATRIQRVEYLGFSPGYVCDSETMFMLSKWEWAECDDEDTSLWRYDGTYWERVYLGFYDEDWEDPDSHIDWVYVSPDFNETNTLYVASHKFGMWRSTDAGCSWDQLTFPCEERPWISAAVVIDEDTVIAGGRHRSDPDHNAEGYVYKTTRHGARPWDDYEYYDYPGDPDAKVISFALEPGYEDPGSILLGDDMSQVFISEDGGEEWELVGDCATVLTGSNDTWVIFDPAYPTNPFIYAAAGDVIARCEVDFDEDWADQTWEVIYTPPGCPGDDAWEFEAAGIAAAGDTALYVTTEKEVEVESGNCDDDEDTPDETYTEGGAWRSLNPDADDAADVVFERLTDGLVVDDWDSVEGTRLYELFLTCDTSEEGCAENVLWALDKQHRYEPNDNGEYYYPRRNVWVYEDTLAAPVVLDMPLDEQKLGTTDSATLSWNELCGATCYEVSLFRYCPECPEEEIEVDISHLMDCHDTCDEGVCYECTEEICIVVDDLLPGETYYWQVRVCIGEPTLSKWSEERSFMTALEIVVELCSPECGGQAIILTPNFSWDAVDGATGYDIELATTETFTAGVVRGSSTVNAWVLTAPLEYAETYYWRVRAEADGVFSDWSVCIFTTLEEPVVPPPPVVVQEPPPAPQINIPPAQMITPNWIYAVIGIGAALCVVVIVLIVRTRRPPA